MHANKTTIEASNAAARLLPLTEAFETGVSEEEFRHALLGRMSEISCEGDEYVDPQAPKGRLFARYGATMYELAFAHDEPNRTCPRVLRALQAYRDATHDPGDA